MRVIWERERERKNAGTPLLVPSTFQSPKFLVPQPPTPPPPPHIHHGLKVKINLKRTRATPRMSLKMHHLRTANTTKIATILSFHCPCKILRRIRDFTRTVCRQNFANFTSRIYPSVEGARAFESDSNPPFSASDRHAVCVIGRK